MMCVAQGERWHTGLLANGQSLCYNTHSWTAHIKAFQDANCAQHSSNMMPRRAIGTFEDRMVCLPGRLISTAISSLETQWPTTDTLLSCYSPCTVVPAASHKPEPEL